MFVHYEHGDTPRQGDTNMTNATRHRPDYVVVDRALTAQRRLQHDPFP
jgi:hypothetical protein